MKKVIIFICIFFGYLGIIYPKDTIIITFQGNYLSPADVNYKNTYGKTKWLPGIKLGIKMGKGFYLNASYKTLSSQVTVPVIEEKMKSRQDLFTLGLHKKMKTSSLLDFILEISVLHAKYQERIMTKEIKDSTWGAHGNMGFSFNISKSFFIEILAGYLYATDTIEENKIKLGGLISSLGIGIKF
jgi:hypothetical protein